MTSLLWELPFSAVTRFFRFASILSVAMVTLIAAAPSAHAVEPDPFKITVVQTPPPNAAGWNNTDVTLTLTCSGGTPPYQCPASPQVLNVDGVFSVGGVAADNAGGTANWGTTISIDKTAPTITATFTPEPNGEGWSRGPVNVKFACADTNGSGIKSCPGARSYTKTGETEFTVTAVDKAGNEKDYTNTILIDPSAPTIEFTPDREPDTEEGWYTDPVTITAACDDEESEIVLCDPEETTVDDEGVIKITGFAQNIAGWLTSKDFTVKTDFNGPEIDPTVTGTPGDNGWYRSNVSYTFKCTDKGIGVKTCPKKKNITKDGYTAFEVLATDKLGVESSFEDEVYIDKAKPKGSINKLTKNTIPVDGTFTGKASDVTSGINSGFITYSGFGSFELDFECDISGKTCTWSAPGPDLVGKYSAKVTIFDEAGNAYSPTAYRFTVI